MFPLDSQRIQSNNMNNSSQPYNTVIADSQFLITESLKIFIDQQANYHLVGIAESYNQLQELLTEHKVDLLITDFGTFDYPSIHSIEELMNKHAKMRLLILTNQISKHDFNELTLAGIKNIIYKTADSSELEMAIETTMRGRKFYADEVLELIMETPSGKDQPKEIPQLTIAENDIVKLIVQGMTTKEIAAQKHISFHTVMTHRKNIFRKLNVNSSSELIMFAIKAGWIDNIEYYI